MSSMIDPFSGLPKYHQLAEILRQKIATGEWEAKACIPSERDLENTYRVSRPTIRQAIELLIREGLLYREHGRGTFVMPQKLQKGILELTSFSEDLIKRGMKPGQKILSMHYENPPAKITQLLDIKPENKVLMIKRIRL